MVNEIRQRPGLPSFLSRLKKKNSMTPMGIFIETGLSTDHERLESSYGPLGGSVGKKKVAVSCAVHVYNIIRTLSDVEKPFNVRPLERTRWPHFIFSYTIVKKKK